MEKDNRNFIDKSIQERTKQPDTRPIKIDGDLEASIKETIRDDRRSRTTPREREVVRESQIRRE